MSRPFSTAFRPSVASPSCVSAAFSLGTVILFTSAVVHFGAAAGGAAGGAGSAAAGFFAAAAAVAFFPAALAAAARASDDLAAWSTAEPWPGPGPPCGRATRRGRGPQCTRAVLGVIVVLGARRGHALRGWSCPEAPRESSRPWPRLRLEAEAGCGQGPAPARAAAARPAPAAARPPSARRRFFALARQSPALGAKLRRGGPLRHDGPVCPPTELSSKSTFGDVTPSLTTPSVFAAAAGRSAFRARRAAGPGRRRRRRFLSRDRERDLEPGPRPRPPAVARALAWRGRGPARALVVRSLSICAPSGEVSE